MDKLESFSICANKYKVTMVLNYQRSGNGYPVVIIHGLFGSLENLNVIAKSLNEDYDVINIDVTNHGKSQHVSSFSYESMAQDVFETLDSIAVKEFHLLGHSMGGKIAMTMALSQPSRVLKLVCADIAPVSYEPRHNEIIKGLKAIPLNEIKSRQEADKVLSNYISEIGVRQFLLKSLYKNDTGFAWRFNLADIASNYSLIIGSACNEGLYKGDVLFIKGELSDYILTEHRPAIMSLFPNSSAKIISGAGHWLHAEKPTIFNNIVKRFLKEQ